MDTLFQDSYFAPAPIYEFSVNQYLHMAVAAMFAWFAWKPLRRVSSRSLNTGSVDVDEEIEGDTDEDSLVKGWQPSDAF